MLCAARETSVIFKGFLQPCLNTTMARGKRTSPSQRQAVVAALHCTHRRNGRPNYKRIVREYKLHERTVRQFEFEVEFNIPQKEMGWPPKPGNTALSVAKKLLCLPTYKRKWPLRRLADEIHVTKSTLHKVLPRAKLYIENPGSCVFKSAVNDSKFHEMALDDVKGATESIWVTMYSLTDPDYFKALIDKRKEFPDMDIKVVIDIRWIRENKTGLNAVCDLIASGIDVFHLKKTSKINHRKLAICDVRFAATGTFNWTKAGTHSNDEDLTYLIGFEPVEEAKKTFLIQLRKSDRTCRLMLYHISPNVVASRSPWLPE